MKNINRKSRWTRILAGLSAVVMVITSLGIMPISAAETEPAATTVIAKMTFDDGTAYTGTLEETTSGIQLPDTLSAPGHTFKYKSNAFRKVEGTDTWYGGTYSATLADKGEGDKYYVGTKLAYTDDEGTDKTAVPEIWYTGTDNANFKNNAFAAGEQMVYEFSVNPSYGFNFSLRPDAGGIYTLFQTGSAGLVIVDPGKDTSDAAKLAVIPFPNTTNEWYDIRVVYTAEADGSNTVSAYIGDVCYLKEAVLTNAISEFTFTGVSGRAVFGGSVDNFAVTKYAGIKYDADDYEMHIDAIEVVPELTFDNWSTFTHEVATAPSTAENYDLSTWTNGGVTFKFQNDAKAAGTVTAGIATKEGNDKYYAGHYIDQGEKKNGGIALNITGGAMGRSAIGAGQQMVYEFSVRSDKWFAMYTRTTGANANITNFLYTISGGKLYLFDGTKVSNVTTDAIGVVDLPASQWVDIRIVYTQLASSTTVSVYLNGKIYEIMEANDSGVSGTVISLAEDTTPFSGNISRLTINGNPDAAVDNFAVTRYTGIQYDPADAEIYKNPVVTSLIDFDFNGDEYAKYITDPTNNPNPHTQSNPNINAASAWNDFDMKNGPTAEVIKDADNDYSVKFQDVDGGGDKLWIQSGLVDVNKHPGLYKDEQLHISTKIHTATTINSWRAITFKNYGDKTTMIDNVEQRLVVPILSYNATNRALRIDNGGYLAGFGTADVQNAALGTITLPENTWVKLDLVYTKKETKSTVDVYIDGIYRGTGFLGATYLLDGPYSRWQIGNGHYDDIAITSYRGSAAVDPDDFTQGTPVEPEDKTFFSYDGDDTVSIADRESKATPGDGHADNNSAVAAPGTEYAKFGKADGNLAYTFEPYRDWADDVAVEDQTEENALWIWKRMMLPNLNQSSPPNAFAEVVDLYMTYDLIHDGRELEVGEANYLTFAGAPVVQNAETKELSRYGGLNFITTSVENGQLVFYVNDGKTTTSANLAVANGNLKQWYNVAIQFNARSKTFELYLDGVLAYQGDFVGDFVGINNLYFNVGANGYWVDNIKAATGQYVPAPKAEVEMTLPEAEDLPEGYSWAEDGKTLNINKSTLNAEVAAAYTTADGEKIYFDAEGNVTEDVAEVDQIAVKATADGSFHYYPIKARTGMGRFDLGENRWMIDVADGKGILSEQTKVYVAKYNDNKVLAGIKAYEVDAVDGDTWFIDATDGIEKGDKVFVLSTDGKITPVYKDATDINVVCWGDSLTEGVAGNGVDYPAELAKLIDYNVINMGVAGESLITIGARSGAYNIVLGEELSIPANRVAADIALSSTELYDDEDYAGRIVPCNTGRGGWTPAEIIVDEDTVIEGKLYTTYGTDENSVRVLTSATFIRDEEGDAVVAPAGSKIKIAAHDVDGDINIYWAGTNMGWDDTDLGGEAVSPENGIVALKKMILENEGIEFTSKQAVLDAEIPADAKFIVIGMTTGGANAWPGINEAYAEEFGDHFLDIKEYLATEQALTDAGVEATDKDLEYIAAGKIPFSLLGGYRYPAEPTKADEVHLNGLGYKLLAKQVYLKMQALGY